jgi:hypothetical protein
MNEKNFLGGSSSPNTEPASLFMLSCALLTREESKPGGPAPNRPIQGPAETPFSAKVDGCLRNVLAAFTRPSSIEDLVLHLSEHDLELFRRFAQSDNATVRYKIYRTDRDFLLMSVGRFDSRGKDTLPVGPEFRHGNQGQMGRNPGYYHFTFSYTAGEPGTAGEMAGIYKQLAMGFQKYATILTYSAGMYYDLAERLAGAEFYDLVRSTDGARRKMELESKRNEFLDAYLAWKSQHTEAARRRMQLVAKDLRNLDPTFSYRPF